MLSCLRHWFVSTKLIWALWFVMIPTEGFYIHYPGLCSNKRNLVVHFRPEERDVEILYHPGVSEKVLRDLMDFLIRFENKPNYGNVYLVTQNGSSLVLMIFRYKILKLILNFITMTISIRFKKLFSMDLRFRDKRDWFYCMAFRVQGKPLICVILLWIQNVVSSICLPS